MFGQDTLREAAIVSPEDLQRYKESLRKPVRLKVDVYCHGYPFAQAEAQNLGPDGLFLGAQGLPTSRNTYLEVEFCLKDRRGLKLYRLPVYVADATEEGTDLHFVETYMSAFRYVEEESASDH